ncbi:GTP-binding protein Rho4p [Monosporozyma unispora]|nr:hypothetical protein C6P44_004278 [Kazachstania unispora]
MKSNERKERILKDDPAIDPMHELIKHKLGHPFARSLSTVESYQQMKEENKIADYRLKIVVVGDNGVGKTSLLMSYIQKRFPKQDEIPTVFVNSTSKIEAPTGESIELALWDTASQEEYNRLRPLSYTNADVLMICYAINDSESLQHAEERWFPEVKHFCYDTPIILVGLKSDLYNDEDNAVCLDAEKVDKKAESLGAILHMQCSAKTRSNVEDLFQSAIFVLLGDKLYSPRPSTQNDNRKSSTIRDARAKLSSKNLKKMKQNNCVVA